MLFLDMSALLGTQNPGLAKAIHLFNLGQLQFALDELGRAVVEESDSAIHDFLSSEISRRLLGKKDDPLPTLVWQLSPTTWEGDWLRYLLGGAYGSEVIDGRHEHISPKMIVVDNRLDRPKAEYLRKAYSAGAEIVLIHLSDEHYKDDYHGYRWCSLVYRNHWSPVLSCCDKIKSFPLGMKSGFQMNSDVVLATDRPWLWGFAGDCNKSSRKPMYDAMKNVLGGKVHLTSGFASTDALDVASYQALLSDCVFAPCPSGWVHLETFRTYEALESGAIPIIERRKAFDYHTLLLGPHPIPTLDRWEDAPELIASIRAADGGDTLQAACVAWWQKAKLDIRMRMQNDIGNCWIC